MEMRSVQDVQGLGVDITPQLPPIAFSLSDPFLHSHCSSCFNPLPHSAHHQNLYATPIRYCSLPCSQIDSPRYFTSAEHHLFLVLQSRPTTWHDDTSDLRTALRLLHHFTQLELLPSLRSDRIGGLLTNYEKLKQQDDVFARISEGGRLMSLARRMRDDRRDIEIDTENSVVEEMVLCIVLTNAVEVQVNEKKGLGVAVYGPCFSWINHSCTPNACYRFLESSNSSVESTLRIAAFGNESEEGYITNELCGYGPRIVVRSIKSIKKGEEVCVAYTDLMQPKGAFQYCCLVLLLALLMMRSERDREQTMVVNFYSILLYFRLGSTKSPSIVPCANPTQIRYLNMNSCWAQWMHIPRF